MQPALARLTGFFEKEGIPYQTKNETVFYQDSRADSPISFQEGEDGWVLAYVYFDLPNHSEVFEGFEEFAARVSVRFGRRIEISFQEGYVVYALLNPAPERVKGEIEDFTEAYNFILDTLIVVADKGSWTSDLEPLVFGEAAEQPKFSN